MSDGSTSNVSDFDDMDDNDSNASFSEDGKPIKSEWPVRSQEALHFWDIVSFLKPIKKILQHPIFVH